jgi:hypothetical protein
LPSSLASSVSTSILARDCSSSSSSKEIHVFAPGSNPR